MLDAPPAALPPTAPPWRCAPTQRCPRRPTSAIRRACAAPVVHVLDPASRSAVRNTSFWSGWLRGELVGPHGAALANTLFCADGTPVVEYHRQHWRKEPNSPLYALLSRQLGLVHWTVVDRERGAREYAGIRPDEVVATAHAALQGTARACESCGVEIG